MVKRTVVPAALCCAVLLGGVPSTASALCVKVKQANLRAGPGTDHAKSWEVYQYMPLKQIGKTGNWYQVEDMDGDMHWIYGSLVTDKMRCGTVKVKEANVRTGPGTSYAQSPLSPVEKYYSFKIIESKNGWVKVNDEVFNEGWMAEKLLWVR
jgi:SH3-like domain-containing protein